MSLAFLPLHDAPGQAVLPGMIAIWPPDIDGFPSTADDDRLLAATNFASFHVTLEPPGEFPRRARLLLSSDPDRETGEVDPARFVLLPGESVLLLAQD